LIADRFIFEIAPFCEKWQTVGSIRRQKLEVNDVDILIIPRKGGGMVELAEWGKNLKDGNRVLHIGAKKAQLLYMGVQVDIYFATSESWVTLMVIRTGSAAHNIMLCQRAKKLGLVLHADGRGIWTKEGSKLKTDSEEEFFNALGLPYLRPKEREV
jgi:DNA polymerase (family 10)